MGNSWFYCTLQTPQTMLGNIISLDDYRLKCAPIETRVPWGEFPPIFIFSPLGTAKNHPEYIKAKQKSDNNASLRLVRDIINDDDILKLKDCIGNHHPIVVSVQAMEEFGVNKIPAACAYHISTKLNFTPCCDIVQINTPNPTNKGAYYRLSQYPLFDGQVISNQDYIIIDDTVTMGGTIASLRGFIENNGGNVLVAIALTGHPGAANLNLKESMLRAIYSKHGSKLNEWWKSEIGFGIDKLTQGEAGHIKKAPSIEAIKNRIAESRPEG